MLLPIFPRVSYLVDHQSSILCSFIEINVVEDTSNHPSIEALKAALVTTQSHTVHTSEVRQALNRNGPLRQHPKRVTESWDFGAIRKSRDLKSPSTERVRLLYRI